LKKQIEDTMNLKFEYYEEVIPKLILNDVDTQCHPALLQPAKMERVCSSSRGWFSGSSSCSMKTKVEAVYRDCASIRADFHNEQSRINKQMQRDYNARVAEAKNAINRAKTQDERNKIMKLEALNRQQLTYELERVKVEDNIAYNKKLATDWVYHIEILNLSNAQT
jgi:hypothetical protein